MLVITKGATKNLIIDITGRGRLSNPYYLFVIYSELGGELISKVFLTDVSNYPNRYAKFKVTEGTTFTVRKGSNHYLLYEKDTNANTDIPTDDYLLSEGILRVNPSASETDYENTITQTDYVHERYG